MFLTKTHRGKDAHSNQSFANTVSGSENKLPAVPAFQLMQEEEPLQGKFETVQKKGPEEEEPLQRKFETVQKKGPEEEEPLQGKFETVQKKEPEEEEPVQGKFILPAVENSNSQLQHHTSPPAVTVFTPPVQRKANNTGLPDNLKSGVENLSGFSMDNVKVHYNSSKPAQLNALAYAQGTDIHIAGGQEKHLPHEAWHVVQQMQGRVQPTMQMKGGVNVNDDAGLEQEADTMGAKAMSVQLLESDNSNNTGGHQIKNSKNPGISDTAQLVSKDVSGGTFRTLQGRYFPINDENTPKKGLKMTGARILLDFIPNEQLDADTVSLVQTVNDFVNITGEEKPERSEAQLDSRKVKTGSAKGTAIDQVVYNKDGNVVNLDPRYTETRLSEKKALSKKPPPFPPPPPSAGYSAHKVKGGFTDALLKDQPAITHNMTSVVTGGMEFEVAALAKGERGEKFVGSVKWGWSVKNGTAEIKELSIANPGSASLGFIMAADEWNKVIYEDMETGEDFETMQLPISKYYLQIKKLPVNSKRSLLKDKIEYAGRMQLMLDEKIKFAVGDKKVALDGARKTWARMQANDEFELKDILIELALLDKRIEGAQFKLV